MSAGCFGKLPIFGDFIRSNANGPEVGRLDQWFQEGIYLARQTLGSRWDAGYDKAPASRFVFHPPGAARFLIGVCTPGTDKAGRRYPFVVFHTLEAAPFDRDAALLPELLNEFLEQAQETASKGWIGGDVKQLAAKVESLKPVDLKKREAAKGAYEDYLRTQKSAALWTNLLGTFDSVAKYSVVYNLQEIVKTVRASQLGSSKLGLRLPLPPSLEPGASAHQVSFWMDLVFRLLGQGSVPPLLFWHQKGSSADPGLFMFFNAPSAGHFVPLILPAHESDHICDVTKGAAPEAFRSRAKAVLENGDLSLADLLAKLAVPI